MYLMNFIFTIIITIVSLLGYYYYRRKASKKVVFWPVMAAAWAVFAISHGSVLAGFGTDVWFLIPMRVIGYVMIMIALAVLILQDRASKKP